MWTYIIVGITFALYIGIAIWTRAGSTKEFYVAGGGVSSLANGMATAADWMVLFTSWDGQAVTSCLPCYWHPIFGNLGSLRCLIL